MSDEKQGLKRNCNRIRTDGTRCAQVCGRIFSMAWQTGVCLPCHGTAGADAELEWRGSL